MRQAFRISLLIGFAVNMVFAIPAFVAPRVLESMFRIGTTDTTVWLRNVGILLMIISTMYLAVYRDAFRYLFTPTSRSPGGSPPAASSWYSCCSWTTHQGSACSRRMT